MLVTVWSRTTGYELKSVETGEHDTLGKRIQVSTAAHLAGSERIGIGGREDPYLLGKMHPTLWQPTP